jgi:hypothetical protein
LVKKIIESYPSLWSFSKEETFFGKRIFFIGCSIIFFDISGYHIQTLLNLNGKTKKNKKKACEFQKKRELNKEKKRECPELNQIMPFI